MLFWLLFILSSAAHETPIDVYAIETVFYFLSLIDGDADVLLPRYFSHPEAVVEGTDLGPEVDLRRLVEFVLGHAAALVDDDSEVGGARVEEVTERRVDVGAELLGDELVRHGTDQHYECGEGGIG